MTTPAPRRLYLIRGLPGSGKSTLASMLVDPSHHLEADQFFLDTAGHYQFVPSKIREAHAWCRQQAERRMQWGCTPLAVANTFTQRWEYAPYEQIALTYGYAVFVLRCLSRFPSIHEVPAATIAQMRARFEPHTPPPHPERHLQPTTFPTLSEKYAVAGLCFPAVRLEHIP